MYLLTLCSEGGQLRNYGQYPGAAGRNEQYSVPLSPPVSLAMNSAIAFRRPLLRNSLTASQTTESGKLCARFIELPNRYCLSNVTLSSSQVRTRLRYGSSDHRNFHSLQLKVSSNDSQVGPFWEGNEVQAPSFAEFITSERVKVVAMLALALALCNADRVVMSVAIVPLSLSHGWSRSFSGIVQVVFFVASLCRAPPLPPPNPNINTSICSVWLPTKQNISKRKS